MWETEAQLKERKTCTQQLLDAIDAMSPASLEDGWRISEEIQRAAVANGTAGMTMGQIDEEIAVCRRERREGRSVLQGKTMQETPQLFWVILQVLLDKRSNHI